MEWFGFATSMATPTVVSFQECSAAMPTLTLYLFIRRTDIFDLTPLSFETCGWFSIAASTVLSFLEFSTATPTLTPYQFIRSGQENG
jgi:hypothetical protein